MSFGGFPEYIKHEEIDILQQLLEDVIIRDLVDIRNRWPVFNIINIESSHSVRVDTPLAFILHLKGEGAGEQRCVEAIRRSSETWICLLNQMKYFVSL